MCEPSFWDWRLIPIQSLLFDGSIPPYYCLPFSLFFRQLGDYYPVYSLLSIFYWWISVGGGSSPIVHGSPTPFLFFFLLLLFFLLPPALSVFDWIVFPYVYLLFNVKPLKIFTGNPGRQMELYCAVACPGFSTSERYYKTKTFVVDETCILHGH